MIWTLFFIFLMMFSARELCFGLFLVVKSPKPSTIDPSNIFDFIQARRRRPPQVFVCEKLGTLALGWRCLFGDLIFVDKAWWTSRSTEEKQALAEWFSIANQKLGFLQRLFTLFSAERVDRDVLIERKNIGDLLKLLESIKIDLYSNRSGLLEHLLIGLSLYGGPSRSRLEGRMRELLKHSERYEIS